MSIQFIHLHLHTEYSIVDGIIKIPALIEKCVKEKIPAIAVTDMGNLFGMIKFYQAAVKAGIKPIIGAEVYLPSEHEGRNPSSIVLLCQNQIGYKNLTKILSDIYLNRTSTTQLPFIEKEWLFKNNEGLLVLSGGVNGEITQKLIFDDFNKAEDSLKEWQAHFSGRFYLEIQRIGAEYEKATLPNILKLATKHQVPVVATNNVRFLSQEDFDAHETRVCINQSVLLEDPKRPKNYRDEQYLRSQEEMCSLFSDIPEALQNTVEIAKRCNFLLELNQTYLPQFPVPSDYTTETYLAYLSKKGLEHKIANLNADYFARLDREIDVINSMGFAGYFLIVADFIQWSKDNGIPVGPGRGSGAGSLVAYVLGITDLDPIEHELLFERFLNPERVSMPDFDIDFCMEGRDRVIEYVANKYGQSSVSQIITFGTMAAKAVIRDVGRVMGFPYGFIDKIAKMIPFELGITLDKALAQEDLLQERYKHDEEVRQIIDMARKLEGVVRNVGKHAGGVVISPSALTDFLPLYCEASGEGIISQFDKDDVETVGLVKFDFLGLRTLTIIDWAVRTINSVNTDNPVVIEDIPLDDKATYDLLKTCQSMALFQLESRGMRDLIKRLQPECFDDIVALVALFRPGPLQSGMVDDFMNRKHGKARVDYFHPLLETILKPTYGIILYQEQVMQIAQVLAGYTLGGADLLRRAMGKKKPEEMAKQREIFIEGAKQNNVDKKLAADIFNLIDKFAGYGFNKSHSAAYALIAYQTAWLKAHYPAAFMAAVLSADMDNTDKTVSLITECKLLGLDIVFPDINRCEYKYTIADDKTIIYGLGAIKGVGKGVAENIVLARKQQGDFINLFDFCRKVDAKTMNRRTIEALIRSGCMDKLGQHRASLLKSLDKAFLAAEQHDLNKRSGQGDLFGQSSEETPTIEGVDCEPWTTADYLQAEKETLGLYLSGHPMDYYRDEVAHFITCKNTQLKEHNNRSVTIVGFISGLRNLSTKKGDRMAVITIDDGTARVDVTVFPKTYQEYREHLVKEQLVVIQGETSIDDFTGDQRVSANALLNITQAREQYVKCLKLTVDQAQLTNDFIATLHTTLSDYMPGKCNVVVNYLKDDISAELVLGKDWCVNPCDELIDKLKSLSNENVDLIYT